MGVELLAGPATLIPRVETEILGRAALEKVREAVQRQQEARVIDVCTGSGNLALAFVVHEPLARVWGSDLSPEAVEAARANARFLEAPPDRIEFRQGDLLDPFENEQFLGRTDVVCCNPPYISSGKVKQMPEDIRLYEPVMAFDGGPFGVSIIDRMIRSAPRLLKPGGWLCLEIGAGTGEAWVKKIGRDPSYSHVESRDDDRGVMRALLARRS